MITALDAYAAAVFSFRSNRSLLDVVYTARRAAGISMNAAEASLERALSEPRPDVDASATAMQNLTYARRLSGALTALTASLVDGAAEAPSELVTRVDRYSAMLHN